MKKLNTVDEVLQAMKNNQNFKEYMLENLYEYSLEMQGFLCEDADIQGLEYHDNYNSFFYTIKDRKAFLESYYNYIQSEEASLLLEKENTLYLMDYNNKNYDLLDAWLDKQAEKLMHEWEEDLHFYEREYDNFNENGYGRELIELALDNNYLEDYALCEIYEDTPILYKESSAFHYERV